MTPKDAAATIQRIADSGLDLDTSEYRALVEVAQWLWGMIVCCHCGDKLPLESQWHPCAIDGCPNTLCSVCAFRKNNRCPEHKGRLIGYTPKETLA